MEAHNGSVDFEPTQVRQLRERAAHWKSKTALAREFGIGRATVYQYWRGVIRQARSDSLSGGRGRREIISCVIDYGLPSKGLSTSFVEGRYAC